MLDANVTGTSISKSYVNGVLTLTGVAPIADYIAVLAQSPTTTPRPRPMPPTYRIVTFVANDGMAYSTMATATISDPPAPSSTTQLTSSPTAGVNLQQNDPAASSAAAARTDCCLVENARHRNGSIRRSRQSAQSILRQVRHAGRRRALRRDARSNDQLAVPSVVRNGSEVVVTGTAGDDTFEFVAGASENTVIVRAKAMHCRPPK